MFDSTAIRELPNDLAKLFFCRFDPRALPLAEIKARLGSKNMGNNRAAEIFVSRNMISWLLAKLDGPRLAWDGVELLNHVRVKGFAGHLSLSHTKNICVLAWSPDPVGVDIELRKRKVGSNIEEKFVSKEDSFSSEGLLEKWCVKEAAFKALSANSPKTLKEIVINDDTFYYGAVCGNVSLLELEDLVLAVAKVKNEQS